MRKRRGRLVGRLLLGLALLAAGAAAFAEYRTRLEAVPAIASALRLAGIGMPSPEATPTPPVLVVGTGAATAPATSPAASPAATPKSAAGAKPSPSPAVKPASTSDPGPTPATRAGDPDALPPGMASVRVTSDPPGFPILVDDRDSGKKTPATVIVSPGFHVLSLDAPGYRPWEFGESFEAGDTLQVPAQLVSE